MYSNHQKPTSIVEVLLALSFVFLLVPPSLTAATCDPSPEAVENDNISLRNNIVDAMDSLVSGFKSLQEQRGANNFLNDQLRALDEYYKNRNLTKAEQNAAKVLLEMLSSTSRSIATEMLASTIVSEFIGAGKRESIPATSEELEKRLNETRRASRQKDPLPLDSWFGTNGLTCNQFKLTIPTATQVLISFLAETIQHLKKPEVVAYEDVFRGKFLEEWIPYELDQNYADNPVAGDLFSQCEDNRIRWPITDYPQIVTLERNGDAVCTGTLVGPRHVLTAAHCVYLNGIWYDFEVVTGRDGPLHIDSVSMSEGNTGYWTPTGGAIEADLFSEGSWYWIPGEVYNDWNNIYNGMDIAMLVIPKRLGDVTGWMGMGYFSESILTSTYSLKNRGYPSGGSWGYPIGYHPIKYANVPYGDFFPCHVGNFDYPDADGKKRLAQHSCDTSRGHSGGPIFTTTTLGALDDPVVTLIIHGNDFFADEFDCENNQTPFLATRITPEYIDWALFFRSWAP